VVINTPDDLDNDNLTQALTSSLDSNWQFEEEDPSFYQPAAQGSISNLSQGMRSNNMQDIRSEQSKQHPANTMMPQYEPPLKNRDRKEEHASSQLWRSICMVGTFWMPDSCIRKEGDTAKLAWRYVAEDK
jgi:hypothetical protein